MKDPAPAPAVTAERPRGTDRRRATLTLVLIATAIGVLDAVRQGLLIPDAARAGGPGWGGVVVQHLVPWWLWGLLVPLIVQMVRRFPLDQARARMLAAHGVASIAVALVYEALLTMVARVAAAEGLGLGDLASAFQQVITWRLTLDILTYWAIAGALQAVGYHRRLREQALEAAQRETEVAVARLAALEARLHPHFLFNTLHTVAGLVREARPDEAVETIARLSELLRRVLRLEPGQTIPLDEELEITHLYMDIEETRFADRLTIRRKVDPATLDAGVPPFLLQPLVENAFRHGFERTTGPAEVALTIERIGGDLVLTVRDSGPGFGHPDATRPDPGTGLRVTRERLSRMYGARGVLHLANAPGGGAVAEVRLPFEVVTRPGYPVAP